MESDTPRTDTNDWITQVASVNLTGQDSVEEERVVDAKFARELERELAGMREQRDEAQRELCRRIATTDSLCTPTEVAELRGWDCFAQKKGGGA